MRKTSERGKKKNDRVMSNFYNINDTRCAHMVSIIDFFMLFVKQVKKIVKRARKIVKDISFDIF